MEEKDIRRIEYRPDLKIQEVVDVGYYESPTTEPVSTDSAATKSDIYKEPDYKLPSYSPESMDGPKPVRKPKRKATPSRQVYKDGSTVYQNTVPDASRDTIIPSGDTMTEPDSLTEAVKAYNYYNPGISLKQGNRVVKGLSAFVSDLKDMVSQDERFSGLPDAIKEGDISSIDKYRDMAENIDGDIIPEMYPIADSLLNEVRNFMDTINTLFYDGKIDWVNIDDVIEKEDAKRTAVATAESQNKPVDYKAIAIDTQIAKFVDDRINLLDRFAQDILEPTMMIPFTLPKDGELLKDYYDDMLQVYKDDKLKMDYFLGTNAIEDILKKVNELKPKVLRNRQLLAAAEQEEFFKLLPFVKRVEDTLTAQMVDLYKSQMLDEIHRADFINSLRMKNSVREHYSK